ncbi:MAG: PhnD/SsuA/transferrin family substrate-binding protein [Candidatus Sericytochromatia bacterium]
MQIRVGGVPEHFNLPWHLGMEEGHFARAGLELAFSEYPTGTGAMCEDLRAGKLDLAVALTEGLLMDIARHDRIVLLAPYVLSPLRWGVHVAADSGFTRAGQLADATFAISRYGSGSHLMALLWAREQGWDPQKLKFTVAGGLEPLERSVHTGAATAFLWEVFTTLPRVEQGSLRRLAEFPTPWPCFMIAARPETASERKAELDTLLQVLYGLTARCMAQAGQTIAEVARRHQLDPSAAATWFADVRWATDPQLPDAALEQTRRTLKELGLI